eukprot:1043280-Amphidinium_carterae.1
MRQVETLLELTAMQEPLKPAVRKTLSGRQESISQRANLVQSLYAHACGACLTWMYAICGRVSCCVVNALHDAHGNALKKVPMRLLRAVLHPCYLPFVHCGAAQRS